MIHPMFGITEITKELSEKSHRREAFHVRLNYINDKPTIDEQFFICDHDDDREACLHYAKTFRNNALMQLQKEGIWPPDRTHTKPGATNTSGTVGVRLSKQWSKSEGVRFQTDVNVWTATWSINAKNHQCSFSEGRYGASAFDMALECRKAKKNLYPYR